MNLVSQILTWLPYLAISLVYFLGANLDVMEVDAAQYASISLEMLKSGKYLQVLDRHVDYLDKPPLLFWLSALSMKLLGIGTWQYKLPSILFSFLGLFSTFKLGERLYSTRIGHHAAMILGGSLAMIMINNDIKTDTILVSSIIFSIWMLVSYLETKHFKFILGAALGIVAAMLTKGPIGLMMPGLAIAGHLVLKNQWKPLLDWKWLMLVLCVGILLIPMCLGLYQQFGTEGLEFYFWTQSFGRITGDSSWQNDTTPLYFFHVFAWSYLPWVLLAVAALLTELRNFRANLKKDHSEFYLISGIVLVWAALSMSRFKLPHYIFVVYPLIAILAAKYVNQLQKFTIWAWVQLVISTLAVLVLAALLLISFPEGGWMIPLALFAFLAVAFAYFFMSYRSSQVVVPSFIMSIAIGVGLNAHFYPELLTYQANAQVGKWRVEHNTPEDKLLGFSTGGRSLDFYNGGIVAWLDDVEAAGKAIEPGIVIYASQDRYNELKKHGLQPERELVFNNFEVQRLSVGFLNPKTRENFLNKRYLLFY